jgi:hypothetical protein
VVNALSRRLDEKDVMFDQPFATFGPQFARIVAAFRNSDCAGARGISEATKAILERLVQPAPPS